MAEIIGTIAAASQLAKYLTDICDVLYTSVNASRILENHKTHVHELRTICIVIRESPSLQTSEVTSCISQIVDAIDQSIIFSILKKPRSLRGIVFFISQKPLLEFFQRLESHKASLNLCVTATYASKINTINDTVQALYSAKNQAPSRSAQTELNIENKISSLSSSMPKNTEANIGKKVSKRRHQLPLESPAGSGQTAHTGTAYQGNNHESPSGHRHQPVPASSAQPCQTAHTGTAYQGNNHEGPTGHHHVGPTFSLRNKSWQGLKRAFGGDRYESNDSKKGNDGNWGGQLKSMHVGPEFTEHAEPEKTGGAYYHNVKHDDGLQQVGPVVHHRRYDGNN
ncbi:hypothetical protein F5B18DRAFT_364532 [Nemania serpens]|nr:hypothetical protein F5B18DRAFT_364532 [Nemania serpens]